MKMDINTKIRAKIILLILIAVGMLIFVYHKESQAAVLPPAVTAKLPNPKLKNDEIVKSIDKTLKEAIRMQVAFTRALNILELNKRKFTFEQILMTYLNSLKNHHKLITYFEMSFDWEGRKCVITVMFKTNSDYDKTNELKYKATF